MSMTSSIFISEGWKLRTDAQLFPSSSCSC